MENPLLNRLIRVARHPAGALAAGVLFSIAAGFFVLSSIAAHDRIATADDPVAISDQALAQAFDREVAEHEIQAALEPSPALFLDGSSDEIVANR